MKATHFKRLKLGDQVTLAVERPAYGCGFSTFNGRATIPTGSIGIIGAVGVPSVRREKVSFACVDFPTLESTEKIVLNRPRCSVLAEEIL